MDKQNRSCWTTEVKNLLFRNGFGYAWIHQEVGNEVEFLKSFVQRISDIHVHRQKWLLNINESPNNNNNNKKRSHTQLDSRKQVIAFQDRVITINIKEAQHPLK